MADTRKPPERFPFTKTALQSVSIPSSGRTYVYDTVAPGLALCVTPAGSRTFYVYRKVNGKPERMRLGTFPAGMTIDQARTLTKAITGDIARGVDPLAEKRASREVPTLKELFDRWIEVYAKAHRKSWRDDQRQFEKYLTRFHARRLNGIRPAEVAAWHSEIGQRHGRYMANRVLELLRAVYNQAKDLLDYRGENPAAGVKRFKEQPRDRFLQSDELPRFFKALAELPELYRDFFLLALFTGARRANVQAMRWCDVHLEARIWRIPETKAGVPVVVPLSAAAVEILSRRHQARGESSWVFPAPSRLGHLVEPRKAWRRLCKAAGLVDTKGEPTLRIHDLRRTLGSWQAINGTSLHIIGKALGHSSQEATAIYARLTVDPVRESVEKATAAMIEAGKEKTSDDDESRTGKSP